MNEQQKQLIKDLYRSADYEQKEKIKEAFPELFELPGTGWVKHILGAMVFRTADRCGYGIDACGDWQTFDSWSFVSQPYDWQPATEEEVKNMLIKEAKRRGVWDCPIKTHPDCSQPLKNVISYKSFDFNLNRLWSEYGLVFDNGKWATPLPEEKTETIHLFGNTYKISLVN
jgi:hypothetical protein